ncbi:MAG: anti-sigma F factor [Clostridia bacterium]
MTCINNYMKTEFLAMDINESLARGIAAFFIMPLDPSLESVADVKTAVSEAVTNSVIHGYRGVGGIITMELSLEGRELTVIVRDSGVGIEDIEKARTPMFTTQPEAERSGMGFTVMETFMDELYVESTLGEGTVVTMKKTI